MYIECYLIDIEVDFSQSIYYINDQDESVLLTVVLSEPLNSTDVKVCIQDGSGDADGKCVPMFSM